MKFVKYLLVFVVCCILLGGLSVFGLYKYIEPQLPDVATLKDVRLQIPMQVYSADGKLIAQYGEKRRIPLKLSQIPPQLVHAFVATEDSRYYEHHGIDPVGIIRATVVALTSGHATQGASTITQQLARNFFLSPERTILRKLKEVFLAIRIEQTLTKDEILELYLNKIYLGYRAYGVGAAAHVYFGKDVNQLTLSEMAMIAGLPKAPSTFNPLYSHERALFRRSVVLSRMVSENYITPQEMEEARKTPLVASYHVPEIDFSAPYLTEMVRQEMVKLYGENAYTDGYKIFTTITKPLQLAAEEALRKNVIDYDMRHGYRGPANVLWKVGAPAWNQKQIVESLKALPTYGPLFPAVITNTAAQNATAILSSGQEVALPFSGMRWARKFHNDNSQGSMPKRVTDVVQTGQQVWIRQVGEEWWLSQIPEVNSSIVSINPQDGAIKALVGGFDFEQSKFNRATQALRQLGSNIKPFIYAAALDKGLTLATIINDLPITQWDVASGSDWRPKNSPPTYSGPIRLRQGLGQSKNVVMVRTMNAIGVSYAADYLERFGFPSENIDRTVSLALGSASFTPLQVARGYAAFANGGFLVEPYFITRVENEMGNIVFQARPKIACATCDIPVIYGEVPKSLSDVNINSINHSQGTYNSDVVPAMPVLTNTANNAANTAAAPANGETDKTAEGVEQTPQADIPEYAPHIISTPLAFLMNDALNSNIYGEAGGGWMGTGWRAGRDLKRRDIGGKTGTTNSSKDAWFSGYGPETVTSVWIGFDDHRRSLGRATASGAIKNQITGGEGGAKTAQPAWDDFMKVALEGIPEQPRTPPKGVIVINIDRYSGGPSRGGKPEYFLEGTQPTIHVSKSVGSSYSTDDGEIQELF